MPIGANALDAWACSSLPNMSVALSRKVSMNAKFDMSPPPSSPENIAQLWQPRGPKPMSTGAGRATQLFENAANRRSPAAAIARAIARVRLSLLGLPLRSRFMTGSL